MKLRAKSLTILALLLVIFGVPSIYLARGNKELENKIAAMTSGDLRESRDHFSARRGRSGPREMTVGQLFQKLPGAGDARSLLQELMRAEQHRDVDSQWMIRQRVASFTDAELSELRRQMRKIPSTGEARRQLQEFISAAELARFSNDPAVLLDRLVGVAPIDRVLQKRIENWARTDPEGAVAWFQLKGGYQDFQDGTIAGRKNRAMALGALLRGMAEKNLDLALEIFSMETRRDERTEGGKVLIPLALKQAIDEGDEAALRTVLENMDNTENSPFSVGPGSGNPWFDYTRATSDLSRSVDLLNSLENQGSYGRKMAIIVSARDDLSLDERLSWLKEQIPNEQERFSAFELSYQNKFSNTFGEIDQGILDAVVAKPDGVERDFELSAVTKGLYCSGHRGDARKMLEEISDPVQRAKVVESIGSDLFSE